jgi:hypothetical protein
MEGGALYIEPRHQGTCTKCDNLLEFSKTNRTVAHLREIGMPIRYHKRPETGRLSTSHFFQCPECGQVWQRVDDTGFEDGGLGGLKRSLFFIDIIR